MGKNIVLVGMPGAGKSTVGVVLAKTIGYDFLDTDILLCKQTGSTLQAYIDQYGIARFLKSEEKTALSIHCENTVIATGGSMVLSEPAMAHLNKDALTVFLNIPLNEIKTRLNNIKTRGIAAAPDQAIDDIYRHRLPLYQKYADVILPCETDCSLHMEDMIQSIIALTEMYS